MSSEASPSVVTPVDEDRLSMSRYSDAASEFGRKLNLGGSARADDMAGQKRAQAKKDNQRPSGSNAVAADPSRGTGGTTAESSRRQSARLAAGKGKGPVRRGAEDDRDDRDDDDDNDDEDDEDDEDDGDDDPNPEAPQTPGPTPRDYVLAMWAAFEPRDLSPSEFCDADIRSLTEPSLAFRKLVEATALKFKSREDLDRVLVANPLNGTVWGEQIVSKLQRRAHRIFLAFEAVQNDAIETIEHLERVSASIAEVFRRPVLNAMHGDSKASLIVLLTYMLDKIVNEVDDPRASAGRAAGTPAYAGDHNEYNLHLRFATVQANWSTYLTIMRELESKPVVRALFLRPRASEYLRQTYRKLAQLYANGTFPSESVRKFVHHFRWFLQNLGLLPA